MMRRFMDGISFDAESLALEAIEQVGPGGDFLASDHTLSHFRGVLATRRSSTAAGLPIGPPTGPSRMRDRLRDKGIAIMEGIDPNRCGQRALPRSTTF